MILYADRMTDALKYAMSETARRRKKQQAYNEEHGITPASIRKNISEVLQSIAERDHYTADTGVPGDVQLDGHKLKAHLGEREKRMRDAASNLEFEEAARLRDEIRRLEADELGLPLEPGKGAQALAEAAPQRFGGPRDTRVFRGVRTGSGSRGRPARKSGGRR